MVQKHPLVAKLAYQLAPAALVTVVGVLMLSSLSKPVDTAPTAPVDTPVRAEMVFTPTPRPVEVQSESAAEPSAKPAARTATKPKPAAPGTTPARKLVSNEALPPPPVTAPPIQIVPPEPAPDTSMMGRLRSVGMAVRQMPQRAYSTVTSWFAEAEPPRPPAPVPTRNFL